MSVIRVIFVSGRKSLLFPDYFLCREIGFRVLHVEEL